jgi:protein O-GlcNAc transferase
MTNTQQVLNEALQHQQAGRNAEARSAYLNVLEERSQPPIVFAEVGLSLFRLGYLTDAEKAFQTAVSWFPGDAAAHHNLGSYYSLQKQHGKAEQSYQRAASIDPNDPDTRCALGANLVSQGRLAEAVLQFRLAVAQKPDHPLYCKRLGTALFNLSCHDEAIAPLEKSLAVNPGDIGMRGALGCSLNMLGRSAEHVALIEAFLNSPQPLDDSLGKLVLDLFVNPAITVEDEGKLFAKMFGYLAAQRIPREKTSPRPAGSRIVLGYLSSFLHKANYMAFLDGIVAAHDGDRFDIRVYSDPDIANQALYDEIAADGVDILVDLNGFGSIDRMGLLAMKPAPVIASWFNAFSSLGLDSVDYLIGDEIVTPPDEDHAYGETIYRLPGCYLLRHLDQDAPPVVSAPIAENGICTFGSLAAYQKIHTGCIAAWARVLEAVPNSRMILRNANIDEHLSRFLRQEFEKYGIEPARLELMGPADHDAFLRTYDQIDIALDSFPWNGGTTTVEALWQGVPVVCFHGDRWASRAGATLVNAIGHPEWAAKDLDEYVRIAADLAEDSGRLQQIRTGLRDEMGASMLCDTAGFAKKLEAAFEDMARAKGVIE